MKLVRLNYASVDELVEALNTTGLATDLVSVGVDHYFKPKGIATYHYALVLVTDQVAKRITQPTAQEPTP